MHDEPHADDEETPDVAAERAGSPECTEALRELYSFLDGELTSERLVDIRSHLDECTGCLEAFDFEAELRAVIATRCRESVPQGLKDRIAEALGAAADPD